MTTQKTAFSAMEKIAIIGIGCRFPGSANDYTQFWQNLVLGKDCIEPTPANRYNATSLYSKDKAKAGRLTGGRGGYIDGFDEFDPAFFGIGQREALCMDPQQRKLLEVAWEALEDGGQKPFALAGKNVGVFIGAFTLDYKIVQFADLSFNSLVAHTATGTMMTMVSNRLSYCFDFNGPSMSIDTACSSSLVAIHLACTSLQSGESSIALAGGTLLHMTPQYTIAESKGGFLSPEGHSRTFDASANGYVRSEGVGIVVLKRLSEALRDNDPIHAVIIGTGVNQDGKTNGITSPSGDAQYHLMRSVCQKAGITPGDLQYVEAHGTSTPVGDPIEANALGRALAEGRAPGAPCYIGSVKTNIGHTESAAGVAGLIKTALSLKNKVIPPHINLKTINQEINIESQPFDIPREVTPWPNHEGPARAGVNSFGFGGTNAHVLLEEAPVRTTVKPIATDTYGILPLSAQDSTDFTEMVVRMREKIAGVTHDQELKNIAYTLAHRRQRLLHNLSFVYSNKDHLLTGLNAYLEKVPHPQVITDAKLLPSERRLVWVFTGMGPQWWAMGRELFEQEPIYRNVLEECDALIKTFANWSLIDELNAEEASSNMAETWLAQPANFALQVALAALWRSYGIRPDAIVGHSTGEAAAFYEAGVYSLKDAIKIIIHRSRLQQKLIGTGTMLAVSLTEPEAINRILPYGNDISIGAINSPSAITLSGDHEALNDLASMLKKEQIFAKFLTVGVPYHSAGMDKIKDELLSSLSDINPGLAKLPLYLTGREGLARGPELDAEYWWENVRCSVRFKSAIDHIIADNYRLFLEIGPHPVLGHSISECLTSLKQTGHILPSIRRLENEPLRMKMSLASLYNMGFDINWTTMTNGGEITTLPCYPWKRERYWLEAKSVAQIRLGEVDHPLLGRRMPTAEPTWEALFDIEKQSFLNDHRILGNVVFPAAGYIEMAAQAGMAMTGSTEITIADIVLKKALFLPDSDVKPVQFILNNENASFIIATMPNGENEPVVHATGNLRQNPGRPERNRICFADIKARSTEYLDNSQCYLKLSAMGYHYGPAFSPIQEIWIGENEALARIILQADESDDKTTYHCHPVIMDASFQTILATEIPLQRDGNDKSSIRLPLTIAEIRSEPISCRPVWAHACITHRSDDEVIGNITIFDDEGAQIAVIRGFCAGNVDKAASKVNLATMDSWLATMSWIEKPLALQPASEDRLGSWLIFADDGSLADKVIDILKESNQPYWMVLPGATIAFDAKNYFATVQPGSMEQIRKVFDAMNESGLPPCQNVIYLWNLNHKTIKDCCIADLQSGNTHGSYSLVALAKAMLAEKSSARLTVATRGAQAVLPTDIPEPQGAALWGAGRVLWHQELISQRGKLIDLDLNEQDTNIEAARLIFEASAWDEDEIAWRGERRLTSRLQSIEGLSRPLPLRLRPDGCYLVTGAMGALGRLLCKSLIKRGARRLILMGRTALPQRRTWHTVDENSAIGRHIRFIKELEACGAEAILAPVDITDEQALIDWLADFRLLGLPPIRGVFHLAGQVKDTLITEMDQQSFDAAYRPKVLGSFLLHRHLANDPIEHFVLFSSIASLLTTAGQTNYAAGNAFLDALAHHRRALGLPALSIDWGPWATGMIEELGLIEHYRNSRGMSSLSGEAGMDVLERIIGQDCAQVLVATIVDWPVFLSWYPIMPPLVTDLAKTHQQMTTTSENESFIDRFRMTKEDERFSLLSAHFIQVISDVLRLKQSDFEQAKSLNEVGLDSLLAIELRARIQRDVKVALPVVTLLGNTSIAELTEQVFAKLLEQVKDSHAADIHNKNVPIITNELEYPLTKNQTALWFLKHLDPDGFAYNIGGAVEIRAALVPELMFEAVRTLIRRHPSLRANFIQKDGQAIQCISQEIKEDLGFVDVSGQDFAEVYQMIIREYRKPYDLAQDPLMRFRLYRLAPDHFVMMKAVHHIISDAISTFTFIEELLLVYEGMRRDKPVELPPLKARYLDFLNWQNRFLVSSDANNMQQYWLNHLPKEIPTLNLPTDKPRPPVQTHNGASEFFVLDKELTKRVHTLAKEQGMTVFMVLLSAYYTLLYRYTGQDQLIVGSPVLGRTEQEFSSVYGYFVNPLPLYADLSANPPTLDLLKQVQRTVLNGLDNQEYPFVMLVDKLGLKHDPSRSAVFQAMFILLAHRVATEQYGYRLEYIELPEEEGQFDVTLSAYEDEAEQQFHCVFKYNSDLFVKETMERMAAHYINLLTAMTDAPDMPIAALDMLGGDEKKLLLDDFSGREQQILPKCTIVELIEEAACKNPEAIAVSMPLETGGCLRMSYEQLLADSHRIAHNLKQMGMGEGQVVGVCLNKSPDLIALLLGILKTGAAYLPLDPDYPADRLAFMAAHANVKLMVVDEGKAQNLKDFAGECVSLTDPRLMKDASQALSLNLACLEDVAYVIYTSGSTGRPKAVKVSHANLSAIYLGWEDYYRLTQDVSVHAQLANFSFDVFGGDLMRALCGGGTLTLISREILFNTERLYETLIEEKVDCAEFVPAVVRGLMHYCFTHHKRLDFLKLLIVGSDAWKVEEIEKLRSLCHPKHRVVNSYGLTETTIDSTCFEDTVADLEASRMVPIGRPFANSEVYVLDKNQQPVPIGVSGELYIGGRGVSLGYLDQELTKDRFVTLNLHGESCRLYRTGDLANFDARGRLQLIGRADHQVKIRGHRIEVGEIEAQLKAVPGVSDALVVLRNGINGDAELCAYYVADQGHDTDPKEIRRYLQGYLPTYMIPSWFVALAALPLSSNGKVDHNALPAPVVDNNATTMELPVTFYETRMAYHWQQMLGLKEIGLQQDFFDIGCNSIKLIELIYHLQTEFNITISVSQLFKITTLYGMAKTLEHIIIGKEAGLKPYLTFNQNRPHLLFCFPPAGGHGLVYRRMAEHMPDHTLVSFNYIMGDEKILAYADLIESLKPTGPYDLFGYSLGGNLAFEVAKELGRRGHEIKQLVIMDSFRISEQFEFADEHLAEFEKELSQHLLKHTGSTIVAQETLEQARDYIRFCSRTLNEGTVPANISIISDEHKVASHASGEKGAWHGSSPSISVFQGYGSHADMLDVDFVASNAELTLKIIRGENEAHGQK